jgi:hypothetical protein
MARSVGAARPAVKKDPGPFCRGNREFRETVTVYRRDQTQVTLTRDDVLSGDDVLPGLGIPLSSIFVR